MLFVSIYIPFPFPFIRLQIYIQQLIAVCFAQNYDNFILSFPGFCFVGGRSTAYSHRDGYCFPFLLRAALNVFPLRFGLAISNLIYLFEPFSNAHRKRLSSFLLNERLSKCHIDGLLLFLYVFLLARSRVHSRLMTDIFHGNCLHNFISRKIYFACRGELLAMSALNIFHQKKYSVVELIFFFEFLAAGNPMNVPTCQRINFRDFSLH
jgi:hypothetical protein